MACGTTHFLSIWTLWYPDYGPEALVKVVTAGVSVATAVALWPLLPQAIALPSPAQLERANADLQLRVAERDAALAALERANDERERAEAILRQVQKMAAIGQLTGGIAHDFNNLLNVVVANLYRAKRLATSDPRVDKSLDSAIAGATRAARLTDQLLAFGRRQPLQPETHDVNALVAPIHALFAGTLDPAIMLSTDLGADLGTVHIDAAQTENAVLNLLVNARDAMPGGGTLTLRTFAIGDDVAIEVADTGTGMDDATRERAFEPFFTTKPMGRGSGLGLAQVYGFASQSGGRVELDSAPGAGTRVRIILPRARA